MAITIDQQPAAIYPAYAKTILECYDADYSDINYYTVIVGSNSYKVEPNIDNKCYIDLSRIIISDITSTLADTETFESTQTVFSYFLRVKSYTIDDIFRSSNTFDDKIALNMVWQNNDNAFVFNDYVANSENYGKWLNKYSGNLSVALDGKLTAQYFSFISYGYSISGIYVKVYNKDWSVEGDEVITQIPITGYVDGIKTLNISPSMLNSLGCNITEDTMYYEIQPTDNELETLKVVIEQEDKRFPTPTRLAYINSNGATDYFTFKLADENNLAITKNTYISNNVEIDYSTEVIKTRNLIGNNTSEDKIKDLQDLWYSPLVWSLTDDCRVRVTNKKVMINQRRNNKFFTPTATIKFANEFRVIQQ